jgi:hypothetical protein
MSGWIDRVAQLEGRTGTAVRNACFPLLPDRIAELQLHYLYRTKS